MPILFDIPFYQQIISVGAAVICSELFAHPLEVAKISKQTLAQAGKLSASKMSDLKIFSLIKRTLLEFNPRYIYRGLSASIGMSMQGTYVSFMTYDFFLSKFYPDKDDIEQTPLSAKFAAGLISAFASFWLYNPWDIMKIRMITDTTGDYRTLWHAINKTLQTDGFRELYKGSSLNFGVNILWTACDMAIYQHTKEKLEGLFHVEQGEFDPNITLVASLFSSIVSGTITFPIDYMKNLYINDHSNKSTEKRSFRHIINLFSEIYQRNGLRGYANGLGLYLTSSLIYTPVLWMTFETTKHSLAQPILY